MNRYEIIWCNLGGDPFCDGCEHNLRDFRYWVRMALSRKTLEEFRELLEAFGRREHRADIMEASTMSGIYTPRVMKLLRDREDKHKVLDELFELCWRMR